MLNLISTSHISSCKLEDERRYSSALIKFLGGETYEGEVLQNKPHGQGRFSLTDGSFYEGTF